MIPQKKDFQVYGELIIPFYFPANEISKENALQKVGLILNRESIQLIEGDIHTKDGKAHPLIAQNCYVNILDAISDEDI